MSIFQINRNKLRLFLVIGIIIFFVYLLFFSDFGYLTKWKLERERKDLLLQIQMELNRKDSLENRIKLLQTDTFEIERIAREQYGLVKEGEEIYAITKKKENRKE
jgi:cell division protein FtsB